MYLKAVPLALLAAGVAGHPAICPEACSANTNWPGWAGIKYAFTFGDSYSQTGFSTTSTAPSATNPLGNPTYPGYTSSNGPNWVDFLTVKYNASKLQTYNLAYGGATVSSSLVTPYESTVISLEQQVQNEFVSTYTGNSPPWKGANSLFAFWIGINDVGNSYGGGNTGPLNTKIFAVYSGLVDKLYSLGARNFVFINVPPVDRSPLTRAQGTSAATSEKADLAAFNGLINNMAKNLTTVHAGDVNVWVYDSNASFGAALDNPAVYPETSGIKNTTAYCTAYENGTPAQNTLTASCGIPVNQYFWLNSLHPTYPIHDVVAKQIAQALVNGPNVC